MLILLLGKDIHPTLGVDIHPILGVPILLKVYILLLV